MDIENLIVEYKIYELLNNLKQRKKKKKEFLIKR